MSFSAQDLRSTDEETARDGVYYDSFQTSAIARGLVRLARDRIYRDFIRWMAPRKGERILDIGVSDVITDESNVIERNYPYPQDIVCAGLGDGASVLNAYPGVGYRRIDQGKPLPFADREFSIATCNAVLEHVGDDERKRAFIGEMMRVARRVFISVPNRWFPVDSHTRLPLLHFWPAGFRFLCGHTSLAYWSTVDHLDFISADDLLRLMPAGSNARVRYSGLPLGPFSSNLICVVER